MRKLALFLLALPLCAATGDITAVRIVKDTCTAGISCNGMVAEIDLSGLSTGGTYSLGLGSRNNPATAKVVFHFTSPGYDAAGNITTVSRTVWGMYRLRKPYPNDATADETAGNPLTVRVVLSDFIRVSDTSITADFAAGFYTGSNAATGIAVTNNSTYGYANVVARWAIVPYQLFTGDFDLEVVALHNAGHDKKPVAAVKFACTDGSATVTPTATEMTKSSKPDSLPVYKAIINANSFAALATVTCNFTAYPWVGTASEVRASSGGTMPTLDLAPITLLADKNNNFGVTVAYVDPTSTISGSLTSGVFVDRETVTQAGTGATAVVVGPVAATLIVCEKTGSPNNSGTWAGGTSGAIFTPTSLPVANYSGTPAVADIGNAASVSSRAYASMKEAAAAIKAFNNTNHARNDCDAGIIRLKRGDHRHGGPFSTPSTTKTWMTITRDPNANRADVRIIGKDANSGSMALSLERIYDVTIAGLTSGDVTWGVGPNASAILWKDSTYQSVYSNSVTTSDTTTWVYFYSTNTTMVSKNNNLGGILDRNCTVLDPGNSAMFSSQAALAITVDRPSLDAQAPSLYSYDAGLHANTILYNITAKRMNKTMLVSSAATLTDWYVVNVLFERIGNPNRAEPVVQLSEQYSLSTSNVNFAYVTIAGDRFNWHNDSLPNNTFINSTRKFMVDNYFASKHDSFGTNGALTGGWPVAFGVGFVGSYGLKELPSESSGGSSGSYGPEFGGLFWDHGLPLRFVNDQSADPGSSVGNGDYHLLASSPALRLVPAGSAVLPFDLDGKARLNDGNGSAGAYEGGTAPSGNSLMFSIP